MNENLRLFLAAFLITCVFIGGLVGFMVVDWSTQRYMPGRFPHLFLVDSVGPEGATISWMGKNYYLNARAAGEMQKTVWSYRSFLPAGIRLSGKLALKAMDTYQALEARRAAEEYLFN